MFSVWWFSFFKEKVHFVAAISPDSKRIGPLNQVYCYSLHAHLFFAKLALIQIAVQAQFMLQIQLFFSFWKSSYCPAPKTPPAHSQYNFSYLLSTSQLNYSFEAIVSKSLFHLVELKDIYGFGYLYFDIFQAHIILLPVSQTGKGPYSDLHMQGGCSFYCHTDQPYLKTPHRHTLLDFLVQRS